jgi:hypothetical protein
VKQDADIRNYFSKQHLKKSGKIVDILLLNGVNTMEELRAKSDDWLLTALDTGEEKSNEDIFNTALSVICKYCYEKNVEKLLAAGEMPVYTYFFENAPEHFRQKAILHAAVDNLQRAGVDSMSALDAITDEKIERICYIGPKRRELVLLMRDKYRAEHKAINY